MNVKQQVKEMNKVYCNLCDSTEIIPLFSAVDYITKTTHNLVECKNCGLTYVNPQPSKDELPGYYSGDYHMEDPFFYDKFNAYSRYKKLKKIAGKYTRRILDVGCGRGIMLKIFKESGWETAGTELSDVSAQYAREVLGVEVLNKDIEDCNFSKDHFDVITLFHSLEHLRDPMLSLKSINDFLNPDGLLIIEVPRFNSFYSKIFKDKWFHLDVPRHLFHFDDRSFEKLLAVAGFSIIKRKRCALLYDSFGALQSILNYMCSEMNLLNNINTRRVRVKDIIKSKKKRLTVDTIISFLLQPLLLPPLFVLAFFLSIFNTGGTLTVCAKKSRANR